MEKYVMSGKLICALTVVCLAGSAYARPFSSSVLTLDAGGGLVGTNGDAFTTSDGSDFFNHASGGDTAPSSGAIGGDPSLAFDSYFGEDAGGPSSSGYTSATVTLSPGSFILGGTAAGGYFRAGPAVAPGSSPLGGGLLGLFVGRFTTNAGVGVVNGDFQVEYLVGGIKSYVLGGAPVDGVALVDISSAGGAGQTVHDIWLSEVPAPGALALTGLAGLVGIRRRRA